MKLRKQLDHHKGKKVYGYLPKPIKATVNEIVAQLSAEPTIEELYNEWNKINREKLSLYYENKDPTVPLEENKEFRSIKNLIIKAVLETPADPEPTISAEEYGRQSDTVEPVSPQIYDETAESAEYSSAFTICAEKSKPKKPAMKTPNRLNRIITLLLIFPFCINYSSSITEIFIVISSSTSNNTLTVSKHVNTGTLLSIAARLINLPSCNEPLDLAVLITYVT